MKFSRIAVVLLIGFLCHPIYAQEYHTPAEIMEILTKSIVKYEIGPLDTNLIEEQSEDLRLNQQGLYLEKNKEGQFELKAYEFPPEAMGFVEIAERYFESGEMEMARAGYMKVLKLGPNNSQLLTYIGQTYEEEDNHKEAKKWYKKALKANYIDFLAHWFLADIYLGEGDTKRALKEINIAHILNRNNPRILESLRIIYKEREIEYSDWKLTPIYGMSKNEDNSIAIKIDIANNSDWMSYALCKAIWAYEPGYREDMMKETQEMQSLVEERECLTNVAIAYENKNGDKKSDDEAINKIVEVAIKNKLTEFILYEILLIEDPSIAYVLDRKVIDRIADYILKFRTRKI